MEPELYVCVSLDPLSFFGKIALVFSINGVLKVVYMLLVESQAFGSCAQDLEKVFSSTRNLCSCSWGKGV